MIEVRGPFSLKLTAFEMIKNGTWKYSEGIFRQALKGPSGPMIVEMDEEGQIINLEGNDLKFAEKKISFVFGFKDDLDSFYSSLDKPFDFLAEEFYGLRLPAAPDPFQALIEVIAQQQVKFEMAMRSIFRLVQRASRKLEDLFLFPEPSDIVSMGIDEIRKLGMGMRAKYIWECSKLYLEGKLDLRRIWEMSEEEAMKYLKGFKGIGTWTSELFLLYGYRKRTYPAGDLGIRRGIAKIFGKRPKEVQESEVREIIGQYGEWAPYLAFYIMCYDRRTELSKAIAKN